MSNGSALDRYRAISSEMKDSYPVLQQSNNNKTTAVSKYNHVHDNKTYTNVGNVNVKMNFKLGIQF